MSVLLERIVHGATVEPDGSAQALPPACLLLAFTEAGKPRDSFVGLQAFIKCDSTVIATVESLSRALDTKPVVGRSAYNANREVVVFGHRVNI